MRSGPRTDLITIQRDTGTSENAAGERVESWGTYTTAWAQTVYGTGSERREAGKEGGSQVATFRVPASTETLATTTADRISFNGIWDIVGAVPLGTDGVELTAIKRTSP
jgi:head-tail adaptor